MGLVAPLGVVAMLLGFGLERRRRRQEPPPPRRPRPATLPTGTVSFLFTDIEGSTRLLQELGDRYAAVRDQHAAIVRHAIDEGGGVEVGTEGDSFFAAFGSPVGAVRAAVAAQRGLARGQAGGDRRGQAAARPDPAAHPRPWHGPRGSRR